MSRNFIKSSFKTNVSYPKRTQKEIKNMFNELIQPPETNVTTFRLGPSLLGAEFARGRVCQGPRCPGIPDCCLLSLLLINAIK